MATKHPGFPGELGPLFETAMERRTITDPDGYAVSWETVRARCVSAYIGPREEPADVRVDRIVAVLVAHGLMEDPT